jgi:hypothetical protein
MRRMTMLTNPVRQLKSKNIFNQNFEVNRLWSCNDEDHNSVLWVISVCLPRWDSVGKSSSFLCWWKASFPLPGIKEDKLASERIHSFPGDSFHCLFYPQERSTHFYFAVKTSVKTHLISFPLPALLALFADSAVLFRNKPSQSTFVWEKTCIRSLQSRPLFTKDCSQKRPEIPRENNSRKNSINFYFELHLTFESSWDNFSSKKHFTSSSDGKKI